MIFWVKFEYVGGKRFLFNCEQEGMFELLFMLDQNNNVTQYMVGYADMVLPKEHFGWGLDKWVMDMEFKVQKED